MIKTGEPSEPQALSHRGTDALRRWATLAGVVMILLIIAADSYEAWQDYRRVISDNERIQVALSRALAEQTARMVGEIEVVLADYAGWIDSAEGRSASEQALVARLNTKIVSLPFVSSAVLTGADGSLRAGTQQESGSDSSLRDLDVFKVPARARGDALYIDRPHRGLVDGTQTFALSRSITSSTGTFDGVIVARVAFEYLSGFYAGVNLTPDTSIRLARDDGITLVEYPPRPLDSGLWPPDRMAVRASGPSEEILYSSSNGHQQIEVSQKVGGYPILVEVSRPMSSVLQPWIAEERSSALRTFSLVILATILLFALRSALRHQAHMARERYGLEKELAGVQRVEALGFLAASVAHDFNNVLTAIIGYAELSRAMVEEEPAIAGNIDRLLAATERARLLVRRVLTFDPHRSTSYRATPVAPIILEVSQQVQATLPPSITLNVHELDESATVMGEPTEIYQVLMNLCTNAVHAMPVGGTLQVQLQTLDIRETQTLAVGQLLPGQWVRVSIVDSGVGLAAEQTASIFEPFYTTRQPTQGTGIGLTVVRNIIIRMKGALNVDSHLGHGTRMIVYWPSIATPAGVSRPARLANEGSGETVLVIDDERELVALTEELLASLSYEPIGFSDGRAAIEAFRSHPQRFDAILTDERMLPLRGLDVAKAIHDLNPLVPIILMTGHRDAEVDARAQAAGIVEILDKPLRVQMLREALARHLRPGPR